MMKKYSTPLFLAMFTSVFLFAQSAKAFLPLPTIDFSVITQSIKNVIDQVKSSAAVVTTTQTVATISSSIGDAVATVSSFVNEGKEKLKELEQLKKQAEEYKKEYETYKKYTEEKIEQAKAAKENAEKLKALMEDPSAMAGSAQDKLTSTAKSYGGDLGVPTSKEEFEGMKNSVSSDANSKTNSMKDLAGANKTENQMQQDTGDVKESKFSDIKENTDKELTEEELEKNAENEEGALTEEELEKNAENEEGALTEEELDENAENEEGALTEEELDENAENENGALTKEGVEKENSDGNEKVNPAIYDAVIQGKKENFRQGVIPALKGKFAGKASAEAGKAVKNLKGSFRTKKDGARILPKNTSKGTILKEKSPLSAVKANGATEKTVKETKELKPALQEKKSEQNLLKKTPNSGFRKSVKMKTSSLNVFGKKKYDMSFAAAANDHQNSNTGKSTSGDAILPRNIASFCEISVSDLKSDFEKMNYCLAKINKDHDGTDTSDYQVTTEDFKNMRMQNASDALAIALKMENIGAHQEEVLKELDEKSAHLGDNRQVTSMSPYYNMEIAKAIKNYTFVRATRIAYDVFDNMKSLDLRKWEK